MSIHSGQDYSALYHAVIFQKLSTYNQEIQGKRTKKEENEKEKTKNTFMKKRIPPATFFKKEKILRRWFTQL